MERKVNIKKTEANTSFASYLFKTNIIITFIVFLIAIVIIINIPIKQMQESNFSIGARIGAFCFYIIPMAILSCIFGFTCGYVVGILICPIGYPFYLFICNKSNEKANEKQLKHLIELENLSLKFSNNELVEKISNILSKDFVDRIKSADSSSHIKNLVARTYVSVTHEDIRSMGGRFSFKEERYDNIYNRLDKEILGMAIVLRTIKKTLECLEDTIIKNEKSISYELSENKIIKDNVQFDIYYESPNINYIEAKSW